MRNKLQMLTALLCFCAVSLFSQVNVTGGSSATYSTVNAAFAAINAGTHFGAITIDITASTTEPSTPTPLMASGQGAANYTSIVMRPMATATISGVMVTGRGVLELDGVDNFLINGDIAGGPVNRDLTISNDAANTVAATAAIRFIGRTTLGLGATNNSIRNCIIYGNTPGNDGSSGSTVTNSYGIYAGTSALSLTSGGTGENYDDLVLLNNEIRRAYFGLYIGSTTTGVSDNLVVGGNTFGSNTAGSTLSFRGMLLTSVANATVSQNEIFNMRVTTGVSNAGIEISGTSSNSVTITRNKIFEIWSTSTGGWGAYGISLIGGNNHLLTNNVIYDILTTNYNSLSTTFQAFGIRITSGTGHRVYYNSVNLFGTLIGGSTSNCYNAAFMVSSTAVTGIDVRNNIFANKITSSVTTPKLYAVWFPASYNFANANLNNNAYMVTNDPAHFVGRIGTTSTTGDFANLAAWQTTVQATNALDETNSVPPINTNAPFMADNNLDFVANTITPIESGAVLIPALGTNVDYDANTRPQTGINPNLNPDMGAYEFDGLAGVATDAGAQALVNPLTTGCYGASESMVVTIKNYGTASISNIPVTVTVSGAASQTTTSTYTGTLTAGASVNFTVGTVNMLAAGVYSFNASTSLPGDMNLINDAMSVTTRTVNPIVPLPQAVDFTGFTGANLTTMFPNWYEAAGVSVPSGVTSIWTSQTGLNGVGNITARINLFTTTRNEWIVGPKVTATSSTQISFDAAVTNVGSTTVSDVMGSDDMVRVMISTDCGTSYTPIYTISATNSLSTTFTNFTLPLSSYAGQDIIVAFLATDGPINDLEDYDFHLDNINLHNAVGTDAGAQVLVSPATNGCYGTAENMVVTIKNYGTASISNIPVTVTVSGAASQTTTSTYTGPLAAGATVNFTVGTLNMLAAGVYSFDASTSLPGDLNLTNDAMPVTATRTVNATFPLPQAVDFTGFTGANLPTMFPGWYEGNTAIVPTGTTSLWTSQTGLNAVGNITARLNMFTTTRNEWIVGPKVTATSSTQISFDAAVTNFASTTVADVMGSDDMVRVMVSTDCGVSYTPIYTISATNSLTIAFTNFSIPLGSYAGQDIIVAFLAQDGPIDNVEDYDFHLDNINLFNAVATDAGAQALAGPATTGCYGAAENMVVTIKNYGIAPISNIPVTVTVSGTASQTTTATYTGTLAPGATVNFTVGTLNMLAAGVYSFDAATSLPGDMNLTNESMTQETRTVVGTVALPQAVNFTGFTGANLPTMFPNWHEANTTAATGTTSLWTSQTGLNGAGNITARINLLTTTRNEWIVGPKVSATASTQISFDAAVTDLSSIVNPDVMGSDDMVRVMVSTDCGISYTPIYTISATNSLTTMFTNFTVPLSSYAGQDIIVAFLATDGPVDDIESYDFHLDNINLYSASATDAGISALAAPTSTVCFSANDDVVVTINNYGVAPISNVPVMVTIAGPITQTLNGTYTGTIPVSSTTNFTVGTANLSIGGVYTLTSVTSLPGDANTFNDPNITTLTVTPIISISGNTSLCSGGTASVTANGAAISYSWSTGATTNSITVSPSVTTIYTVIGTSASSCTTAITTTVSVTTPTITGTGALFCGASGTGTLTASAFATVNWYASPTATTSLASGNTYIPPVAATTTTYYAEANSLAAGTLSTTLAGGNGSSGNMFDITALGNIEVNGFDVHLNGTAITTIEVWYRPGTYVGFETSNTGWTNILTTTVTGMGTGMLTPVPATFTVPVAVGQTYAFYVRPSGGSGFNYTNGTLAGNIYSQNSDVQIKEGNGIANFGSGPFTPRVFNGEMRYMKVGCTSPRIPVTLTVSPTPTLNAVSSASLLCVGQSATLTASGANTYTWSTSTTGSVEVVSPTTTTNYTVTGEDAFGCSANTVITQNVSACTGIDNNVAYANGILLYPNPANDLVTLHVNSISGKMKLEIYDALGKRVLVKNIETNATGIDISGLSEGIYVYRITEHSAILKQGKLVKE